MANTEALSIFDLPLDADTENAADAEAELDAGKGVPHAGVREWLLRLAAGERPPPPSA